MNSSTASGRNVRIAGAPQAFVLIFAMLMPIASILAMAPNLPQFLRHFSDVPNSALLVPMILTIPALCNAVFSPFVGALSDRLGRRPMFLAALTIHFAVGSSAYFMESLYAILGTRVAVGIAEATIMTLANALLGDYFEQEDRQKWLAYQSILGSIMAAALVLLGGGLGTISWSSPFLMHLLSFIMLVVSWRAIFEPVHSEAQRAEVEAGSRSGFPVRAMVIICAVSLFCSVIYFVQTIQLSRVFNSFGAESSGYIGIAMTIASIGVIAGGVLYRKIHRKTVAQLLSTAYLFFGVGLTSLGLASTLLVGVPLAIIAQVGNGMMIPILVAWALGALTFAHRGRGMGIWNSSFYIGQFLSPMFVSLIVTLSGGFMRSIFVIGLLCLVCSVAALFGLRGLDFRVEEAAEPVVESVE